MRWHKLGLVFDPSQHLLPAGCYDFAQSPQTLVLSDRVRVYFSTRSVDEQGKFLSHVAYVDMSRDMLTVMDVSRHEVVSLGGLGTFDEHGIFPFNVLSRPERGEVWGYTTGWSRRVSVSVETAIGLVISRDGGRRFERMLGPGPILGPSLHEPCLVGDAFVRRVDGLFHMWYIFGTGWRRSSPDSTPDRTYKIGHARSDDGIRWEKDEARQIVMDHLGPEECQALPTVLTLGSRHHMFFCYRQSFDFRTNPGRGYRIGHASSDDLIAWTRDDENPELTVDVDSWDAEMQCYPHVFELDGQVYLLYNGNQFGRRGFGLARLVR